MVGTGKIGSHVIKIAQGFGMKIIAYDAFPNVNLSHELGFAYVSLEQLYQTADIITYHVPARKETDNMLNNENTELIKKGAVIINTSRGSVIQTEALVKGLEEGRIYGAGLDVLAEEEDLKNGIVSPLIAKLLEMDNVIVTPHTAFNTQEALQRILQTTVENINAFESGSPINVVKPQ